ncbi:hypothetical protein SPJ2_1045 [Streptococcus parauberis KRS-02109]|nr:hypothetical protein SPJ2_1045 [Streptococcus parauberis KRS-02109]
MSTLYRRKIDTFYIKSVFLCKSCHFFKNF